MPFQVVYSINQKKVVPLILGGEGLEDILFIPLSITQFTLTAEVLGGNPIGHTFEWELIQDDNPFTVPEVSPLTIENFGSSIVLSKNHGNQTDSLFPDRQVWVFNSSDSANDGPYIITSSTFVEGGSPLGSPEPPTGSPQDGRTVLEVTPPIPNPNAVTPGMLRTQLGDDVYVTLPDFVITGASPPPWPWIMPGASLTNFSLYFLYAPTGQAYFKRWRLWVDKGTPIEDFEDVDIFPFPQDDKNFEIKGSTEDHGFAILGSTLDCRILQEEDISVGGPSGENIMQCPPDPEVFRWNLPQCDGDKVTGWDIQKLVGGKWINEAIGLPLEPREYGPVPAGDIRRIVVHYDQYENSNYLWAQPSVAFKIPTPYCAGNSTTVLGSKGSSSNNIELTSYDVTLIEAAETIIPPVDTTLGETYISTSDHLEITSYNVTLIEAISMIIPTVDTTVGETYISTSDHLEITSYNITLSTGGGSG